MKNIVLFASGSGSNADNICHYFKQHPNIKVVALFCNTKNAGVIEKMTKWNVPVVLFDKKQFHNPDYFSPLLATYNPDLIVLAGFLWLVPSYLVKSYHHKIINIHPALLPQYGGKGMFGHHVHEAVLANKESKHGITIHLVNEHFDEGAHLFQQSFQVTEKDDLNSIGLKISLLEMTHFPKVIEDYLDKSI